MLVQNLIIIVLFLILFIIFFIVISKVKMQGGELFGRPTINFPLQIIGKISILIPCLYLLLEALGFQLTTIYLPDFLSWVAVVIAFEGMLMLYFSLLHLNRYTKMGLPKNDSIALQTKGIYRLSRNPMYFGLYLLAIASNLFVPNYINMAFAFIGIVIHHMIIGKEEQFLDEKFGTAYQEYKLKTKRYF
jgi:protein-S-isoprenylcysteine O-methyltransferase Ste14